MLIYVLRTCKNFSDAKCGSVLNYCNKGVLGKDGKPVQLRSTKNLVENMLVYRA